MMFPFPLPLLLDGATGTALLAAGMPNGCCTEEWAAAHPEAVLNLQRAYVRAGSGAVLAPTFSANAVSLARYGLQGRVRELNLRLAGITHEAVGGGVLVGGSLAPTGNVCEPFGDGRFLDHISAYAEQALALKDAGVDFLLAETMTSLSEARAALIGAWQARLPVFVALTVDERGQTPTGADALAALVTLQALGAAAFGLNCCDADVIEEQLRRLAPHAQVPLLAKPSAGLPGPDGMYEKTPRDFAAATRRLLNAGAQLLGGCCGTGPEHLAAMAEALRGFDPASVAIEHNTDSLVLCNETNVFFLAEDFSQTQPLSCALDMADELLEAEGESCDVLSIYVASNEDAYCFSQNAHMARLPVSFLAENEEALEEALLCYNGRALVDSRSEVARERLEALCAGYGAVLR